MTPKTKGTNGPKRSAILFVVIVGVVILCREFVDVVVVVVVIVVVLNAVIGTNGVVREGQRRPYTEVEVR